MEENAMYFGEKTQEVYFMCLILHVYCLEVVDTTYRPDLLRLLDLVGTRERANSTQKTSTCERLMH